jgi:hypothetical protein
VESCCVAPGDTTDGYFLPSQAGFQVSGHAVVPRYPASEITIDLLQSQLSAVCADPLWLDDRGLCTEFEDLLDQAGTDYGDSNYFAAALVLEHLLDRIEDEQAEFEPNGYWLMRLNVAQAQENVRSAGRRAPGAR